MLTLIHSRGLTLIEGRLYVEWGALHKQGYLKSQRQIRHGSFYIHVVLLMNEYFDSVTFVGHGFHPQFQLDLIVIFDANELVKQISLYGSTRVCLSKADFDANLDILLPM